MEQLSTNVTALIVAVLSLLGSIITAYYGYKNNKGIAEVKDGMQSRMLEAKQAESTATAHAEGLLAGEAKEKARTAPKARTS